MKIKRLVIYFGGLFLMTAGVAVSVKSNLGVSPVSSIPYTITCVWGMEMGKATILFHAFLVMLQILLLKKSFQLKNLLQVPVGVVFGFFTTFCNWCMTYLRPIENIGIRLMMLGISTILIAVGIFFYLPAAIMPLAGEGIMEAISQVTQISFPKVKVAFDVSMVTISLIVCLRLLHAPGSVGIGTIAAAILVGTELGYITKWFGKWRDRILQPEYK